MSTMVNSATQKARLPGPVIPAWTQSITNLLPWRVDFDSLGYMLKSARQYGNFYAIWIGDITQVTASSFGDTRSISL